MSLGWSLYIGILTILNIAALWWLLWWTGKPRKGMVKLGEEMESTWDGDLKELNNPLPRWWLGMFHISIIFAIIYLVLFPGLGGFPGLLHWSSAKRHQNESTVAQEKYGKLYQDYYAQGILALSGDEKALATGRRLFLNNCAMCHGSDAGGMPGFPSLTDSEWLHGGTPERIEETILKGRTGAMPPWGPALGDEGVKQVATYVRSLSGQQVDQAVAAAGKARYMTVCVACHGPEGKGNPMLGAPDLTNDIWLYGGSQGAIEASIRFGRTGQMPSWEQRLGKEKVRVLAAYVLSLRGQNP